MTTYPLAVAKSMSSLAMMGLRPGGMPMRCK